MRGLARICLAAMLSLAAPGSGLAEPLVLEFLPPDLAPRDLCNAPQSGTGPTQDSGDGSVMLDDPTRIDFLRRDIRRLEREDAARWFDFIDLLITRRAQLDAEFAGPGEMLARVSLHLSAGRLDALKARALIPQLRDMKDRLTNNQRLQLARFYDQGLAVPQDKAFAQEMLREAAFGGNARALLEIARLQAAGALVDGWDAPLDLTVTMAFGGILGEMSPGICQRAERIAQQYLQGDLVAENPMIALAWRRFAADMGGAQAAWQVVQYHLDAEDDRKDSAEMQRYLRRAVEAGLVLSESQRAAVLADGATTASWLAAALGDNPGDDHRRAGRSLIPYLNLGVRRPDLEVNPDSVTLQYLRELARLPGAPGFVFTDLAEELAARHGRWAGEPEMLAALNEAARRGDGRGKEMLAARLIRYRDDAARLNRAENLLLEAVDLHGRASAMRALISFYRCQAPAAPMARQAAHWARAYDATGAAGVSVSANDLLRLVPSRSPEALAKIQTQALRGSSQARAQFAQRLHSSPLASDQALRIWADRLDGSQKALEDFARMETDLARSPAEHALALELLRRVYLHNGVSTALDLSVALAEDQSRDPAIAENIRQLLRLAGHRGEGAAIRLLARLTAADGSRVAFEARSREIYQAFAPVIEARGDFLALIFALPFVSEEVAQDYIGRAVSLMSCGNKDADELADAFAAREAAEEVLHWRRVTLQFDGGHVLSKLQLANRQVDLFDKGAAPTKRVELERSLEEGGLSAHLRLFELLGNPDLPDYDPDAAAAHLLSLLDMAQGQELIFVLRRFRLADEALRQIVQSRRDMAPVYLAAAEAGDVEARYEIGMLLRAQAQSPDALVASTNWLQRAAEGGHQDAMVELGFALGLGIGAARDSATALSWLRRADGLGHPRAGALIALISALQET